MLFSPGMSNLDISQYYDIYSTSAYYAYTYIGTHRMYVQYS